MMIIFENSVNAGKVEYSCNAGARLGNIESLESIPESGSGPGVLGVLLVAFGSHLGFVLIAFSEYLSH
jgi:hypothetical protein